METFELRYFLAVAQHQNVHRAAASLHVSTSALSKAVSRLEEDMGVKLFKREGRGIRITDAGRFLQGKAAEIVRLEQAARMELAGRESSFNVTIVGAEVYLFELGMGIAARIQKRYPGAVVEFRCAEEEDAVRQAQTGEASLALSALPVPDTLTARPVRETKFHTCAARSHALAKKQSIPVSVVQQHAFVAPDRGLLGRTTSQQSRDGWRDDKFPRRIAYVASTLSLIERLVLSGQALAYMPDYWLARHPTLKSLNISGCDYVCQQNIRLLAKNPKSVGWLKALFDD